MERNIIDDEGLARTELNANRRLPRWMNSRRSLPFCDLSSDDFEILCFLLLRKEYPGESIYYYGKTSDAGRDIVHKRPDGTVRLIQCKRFTSNVGIDKLRPEIAKLFTNVFSGRIPEKPDEVVLYVVPDITSPAASLIDKQSNWCKVAKASLRKHSGKTVSKELSDFSGEWWPRWDRDNAAGLTERIGHFPDLRDEFFGVKKVIDATRHDIRSDVHEAIKPVRETLDLVLSQIRSAGPPTAHNQLLAQLAAKYSPQLGLGAMQASVDGTATSTDESNPQFTSSANEVTLLIESRIASDIGRSLNLSSASVLQAVSAHEPPPLPSAHVKRSDAIQVFESGLRKSSVMAVVGYAESGKTIALSDFARSQQCECLWLSAQMRPAGDEGNTSLLLLSLSAYLGVASLNVDEIRRALEECLRHTRLLIVIDDADLFGDLNGAAFLLQLAASQPARLQIVFGATDTPAFVSDMRNNGVFVTRMPGMTATHAMALYQSMGIEVNATHELAIELLCAKCDGHVGLLRLAARAIQHDAGASDINRLLAEAADGLSSDVGQLHSALMRRFRSSLTNEEFELSRRLAVSLGAFERRLGHALWSFDQQVGQFQDTWNRCVSSVFEAQEAARYRIPSLYQQGLHDYSEPADIRAWHGVAADTLGEPAGTAFNIVDVCDAIVHRLLSGSRERALDEACGYLAIAANGKHRDVTTFLLSRFHVLLKEVANSTGIPRSSRIRWYMLRARLCWDAKRRTEAEAAVNALVVLLSLPAPVSDPRDCDDAAWAVLLVHASNAGRPQLAVQAFEALPSQYFHDWGAELRSGRVFLLLSSYLRGRENPVATLAKFVVFEDKPLISNEELWSKATKYPFWRAIELSVYSAIDREAASSKTAYSARIEELAAIQEVMVKRELPHIAVLLGACRVRLIIDVQRDFKSACELATTLVELKGYDDVRTRAYAHHILGDALRCNGQLVDAIVSYSTALELWPNRESFDRGQSTLMLGVANARNGDYKLGYKLAREAAVLFGTRDPESSMRAHALLEAFGMAIHAGTMPAALRCLIEAHEVLRNRHRHRPEWVSLGQCAMLLAVRTENPTEPTPIPGFTLGLREPIPDADNMLPAAPTLMLAHACGALRRPHRAFAYLDTALSQIDALDLKNQTAYVGWEVAVKAKLLERAAKYGAMAARMPRGDEFASNGATFDGFLFNHIVGKVVNLAANCLPDESDRLNAACDQISPDQVADSEAALVLFNSLQAIAHALRSDDASSLENAYQLALDRGALYVARDLAWFWCFRFHEGRAVPTGEMLRWHWRLCWLSLSIAGNDTTFIDAYCDQERSLWTCLKAANDDSLVKDICNILLPLDVPSQRRVEHFAVCLAQHWCDYLGTKLLISEVGQAICNFKDRKPLKDLVVPIAVKCVDIVLHPIDSGLSKELKHTIENTMTAVSATLPTDEKPDEWQDLAQRLIAISAVWHKQPTAAAFHGVLSFENVVPLLSPTSEANWYVWLRHLFGLAERDYAVFEHVMNLLRSDRITSLLRNSEVPAYLRRRLRICHIAAQGQLAISQLASAISTSVLQQRVRTPIPQAALRKAQTVLATALDAAHAIVHGLDEIEQELRKDSDCGSDLSSCYYERGGFRKLIGSLLCVQLNDHENGTAWLRKSLDDLRLAIAADETREEQSATERSAREALIIAEYLGLSVDREEFKTLLSEVSTARGEYQLDEILDVSRSSDLLMRGTRTEDSRTAWSTDEIAIQRFVDDIVSAMGLSSDRRRSVEDDVRKQIEIGQVQKSFCKHLQPLQNLEHTESPSTAYLFKTKYTCSCVLLGHETVIEHDDIGIVIKAMQRTYCDDCNRREPAENVERS